MDTDKVRSMLAQLDGGIAEEERSTSRQDKRTEGGVKGFAGHYRSWGEERYVHKSLGDSIFPALEDALESEGVLIDISEELKNSDYWHSGRLRSEVPAGSIIRVTASGSLFDARYLASIFSSFATAFIGIQGMDPTAIPSTPPAPRSAKKQQARPSRNEAPAPHIPQLEDGIPDFQNIAGTGDQIGAPQLRSMIQLARSIFLPGVHLNLSPTGEDSCTIGARLQEGRQYLDTDPEILFARYGTSPQEWTLVGSVGHHASPSPAASPGAFEMLNSTGSMLRGNTARALNSFIGEIGQSGFADLPQAPGFSVVPFAVYRTIPRLRQMDISARE
ncbi:hypothetical protein [Kitasatospora sp. MBT66]|uniref:DUF6414 family protein n=1 Tax=Kitasatospora sp. MBT66 TaxID=1444769 RepID=UPI0011EA6F69|nr:hypothetical protein [Kitasatospora sp. MBT66]